MHTDNTSSRPFSYIKFGKGVYQSLQTEIVAEKQVAISVNGKVWLQLLCTPLDLDFLVLGFLYNETIITTITDIAAIKICNQASIVDIWTHTAVESPELFTRTSGCTGGLTGFVKTKNVPFEVTEYISPLTIFDCLRQLDLHQDVYKGSGGIHCSAFFEGQQLKYISEDVGRHNKLDKLAGMRLSNNDISSQGLLLSTGRISSEMIQKAYRMNALVIATLTSPTSLAIELAESYKITLIGYAKSNQFNVYTHPEHLVNHRF